MTVTMKDVAKLAGVSVTTVSRALNNSSLVKEDTARQIREASQKLNYQLNESARILRTKQSRLIGFIGSGMENLFMPTLLKGLEMKAYNNGFNILFGDSEGEPKRELQYLRNMELKQVEGIIFTSPNINSALLNAIAEVSAPVVFASANIDDPAIACVSVDNLKAAYEGMDYLLKKGHRTIGIIRGTYSDTVNSGERIKGVRLALNNYGLSLEEDLVVEGDFTFESGYTGAKALYKGSKEMTAIFAFSDEMAIGALRAMGDVGKRVPEEMAIMGFDNIALSQYVRPSLTSICQSGHELGEECLNLLESLIHNPQTTHRKVFIPHKIVEREST